MVNLISKNKKTKEERIISAVITIVIMVVALAGGIVGKYFNHPEAQATTIIMVLISETCFVAIWIATTIVLRKNG